MAGRSADRLAARYDGDVRTARNAARQAASVNRRVLAAWLNRADVRAAPAAKDTAERVRSALDAGDQKTINAAAHGDLPAAAQAAQATEERRTAEAERQRDQDDADKAAAQQAARKRAYEAVQRATLLPVFAFGKTAETQSPSTKQRRRWPVGRRSERPKYQMT